MIFTKQLLTTLALSTLFSACTPLNIADTGMFDDLSDLKSHVVKGEDINFQDKNGETALINSVLFGNFENVKYLLDNGARVDIKNSDGENAFFNLFIFDKPEDKKIFDLLMAKGVDVNEKNKYGATALSYALGSGLAKHVAMLLDKGANININDAEGDSILSEICTIDSIEKSKAVVDVLVAKNIDLNLKDSEGYTLSDYNICAEDKELFAYLKAKGLK